MDWYIVDKDYFSYLFNFDRRIGYIDYSNRLKLHIGIILTINNDNFYVPISSPKPKHIKMNNSLSFHKLIDDNNKLLAVFNLNNMIPVQDEFVIKLKYSTIDKYRTFNSLDDLNNYIYLLQIEKHYIDQIEHILKDKALKLYQHRIQNPDSKLSNICCDFELLQAQAKLYSPKTN